MILDPPVDTIELLVDLHKNADRQGPGGDEETARAIELAGIDRQAPLRIADIGCGTGASTLVLARLLNAEITAVDFLQEFLDRLALRAAKSGLAETINPLRASMEALPFDNEEFDVVWAEGAIYNLGFKRGIEEWKRFLKPGGLLVASEITWLTSDRPAELEAHWQREYPEIDTASGKMALLEQAGYAPIGYFVLPERCWLENYYEPMRRNFEAFLDRNRGTAEASAIVDAERREIELYETYRDYFSYGVYIASKPRRESGGGPVDKA